MHLDVVIPEKVPAMILRQTVFFPQSILPLHIFELRYRKMLSDALSSNQLFVVACENETKNQEEIPYDVATVGVIRASELTPNGTSNLVLQGLQRVKIIDVVSRDPYPLLQVEPLVTPAIERADFLAKRKADIAKILSGKSPLTKDLPQEFISFLEQLDEYESYIDLLGSAACSQVEIKQLLLSTPSVEDRYAKLYNYLLHQHSRCEFEQDLHARVRDVDSGLN